MVESGGAASKKAKQFYVVNIVCTSISILIWPFVLFPLIMVCLVHKDIYKSREAGEHEGLRKFSFTISIIGAWFYFIIAAALFCLGAGIFLFCLFLPYFILVLVHGSSFLGLKVQLFSNPDGAESTSTTVEVQHTQAYYGEHNYDSENKEEIRKEEL